MVNVPTLPNGTDQDKPVPILESLDRVAGTHGKPILEDFEALAYARNLVAHAAGIERDYKYTDIGIYVAKLNGFSIGGRHVFLGEALVIEKGALTPCIEKLETFLPKLVEELDRKGFLH